jgi:hypothetical protein
VPANMFPFTNALAYPNIGRRVTLGDVGTALSKAATSAGEVFFQAFTLAGLYLKWSLSRRGSSVGRAMV